MAKQRYVIEFDVDLEKECIGLVEKLSKTESIHSAFVTLCKTYLQVKKNEK